MPLQNEKSRFNLEADEPISVTVDASDLTGASAEPLKAIMARYGRPVAARAFADFQQTNLAELAVQLYQLGFTLVHCPTWPNGDGFPKSVVSDILAQDLRDQLEELEGVETFLVAGTSREYIAVANALRRHDKRVVIIAEEAKVARELRLCADEFAILPPTKPERTPATRSARTTRPEAPRIERFVEPARIAEPVRVERSPEPVRVEKAPEPVFVEKAPDPVRIERAPEPRRVERQPEPVREPVKAESADQVKLPSDVEVVAEVRRIVAAEGICTPRRLARALCPVDRTPTGELRSRIANRIQSLVDSGTLLREKLVVGGTSVETILVGEDKTERAPEPTIVEPAPVVAEQPVEPATIEPLVELPAPTGLQEEAAHVAGNGAGHVEPMPKPEAPVADKREDRKRKPEPTPANDIDAFVESFLRSAGAAGKLKKRVEPKRVEPKREESRLEVPPMSQEPLVETPLPETQTETADVAGEPVLEAEPVAQAAAPKKPRSRRRTPSKKATPEPETAS